MIERSFDGQFYYLPTGIESLQSEIETWSSIPLPLESYAGFHLADQLQLLGTEGIPNISPSIILDDVIEAVADVALGQPITYQGREYDPSQFFERDGFVFTEQYGTLEPMGVTSAHARLAFTKLYYETQIIRFPELFRPDQFRAPGLGISRPNDPLIAQARRVLGDARFEETLGRALQRNPAVSELPCFVAGTSITRGDGTRISIEEIRKDDEVLAFDGSDLEGLTELLRRRVTQTQITQNKPVIDFHGTQATPDHVFLTEGGAFMQLTDILETDGVVFKEDGGKMRARTGWPVGSKEDRIIPVGYEDAEGETRIAPMRAGTVCSRRGRKIYTLAGMMHERGYELQADGRFVDAEGDVVTAFWHWGVPDPKLFAGQHAEYRSEIEECADGDALFVSLGAPAMQPTLPARAMQARRKS